tara:strand:+ start:24623 stop:24904 length:282 start_codon:yes stop_codon:yes gene_type:complete
MKFITKSEIAEIVADEMAQQFGHYAPNTLESQQDDVTAFDVYFQELNINPTQAEFEALKEEFYENEAWVASCNQQKQAEANFYENRADIDLPF